MNLIPRQVLILLVCGLLLQLGGVDVLGMVLDPLIDGFSPDWWPF